MIKGDFVDFVPCVFTAISVGHIGRDEYRILIEMEADGETLVYGMDLKNAEGLARAVSDQAEKLKAYERKERGR